MRLRNALLFIGLSLSTAAFSAPRAENEQDNYERSIEAVVRNKTFYKAGHFEASIGAGVMPYDSLINHYLGGGRLTWHIHDHFAWEIVDFQYAFPSTTSFYTDLVSAKGLSNAQTIRLNLMATTNFIVSPLYGKIRLFSDHVVHFDTFLVLGLGTAKTDTIKESTASTGGTVTETSLRSGFDPMFDIGFGFRFYMNNGMGLVADFRDYLSYSETYGKKSLKSNFSVFLGLSFFLPTFG